MIHTLYLPIKGVYYYSAYEAEESGRLFAGQFMSLQAEPSNAYDSYAIQVWLSERPAQLLGYVPKTHSKRLSYLLCHCKIKRVTLTESRYDYQRLWLEMSIQYQLTWLDWLRYWAYRFIT